MPDSPHLPADFPPLLVAAEEMAREYFEAEMQIACERTPGTWPTWDEVAHRHSEMAVPFARLLADLARVEGEREEANAGTDRAYEERDAYMAQADTFAVEARRFRDERDTARAEADRLTTERDVLREERDRLVGELGEARAEIDRRNAECGRVYYQPTTQEDRVCRESRGHAPDVGCRKPRHASCEECGDEDVRDIDQKTELCGQCSRAADLALAGGGS